MTTDAGTLTFDIEGMTCGSCVSHVETRLASVDGVAGVEVRYPDGTASVTTTIPVDPALLEAALDDSPYTASAVASGSATGSGPVASPRTSESNSSYEYDVAVIGGGSAGFAAAIRSVDKGARVVMINEGTIGGTCVNVGCVPSKTLIRAAEARHTAAAHNFDGVGRVEVPVDWSVIRENKNALVDALRMAKYEDILAAYDEITLVEGRGVLSPHGDVMLEDGTPISAAKVILAMGSSPWAPDVPGLEEAGYLDSTGLLDTDALPASLAVVGAGSVGLELAQAYARLGVHVTVVARSRLLSKEDPDIGDELAKHLRAEGIAVLTDTSLARVERTAEGRRLHLSTADAPAVTVDVEEILVASGRRPNSGGLGLVEAGIQLGRSGEIVVDDGQRTANPRVFAAGDVTGGAMHVYVAAKAASIAAENATGGAEVLDLSTLPVVTFTDPGVASVGLTEAAALDAGITPLVSKLGLEHVPRALAARDTRGFIKLVADAGTRKIIGAHIVGHQAEEMIMEPALAVRFGLTIEDITSVLHPYLTSSEGIKLAALTFDKDVAMLSCCAV
jgi:mercuric reductase